MQFMHKLVQIPQHQFLNGKIEMRPAAKYKVWTDFKSLPLSLIAWTATKQIRVWVRVCVCHAQYMVYNVKRFNFIITQQIDNVALSCLFAMENVAVDYGRVRFWRIPVFAAIICLDTMILYSFWYNADNNVLVFLLLRLLHVYFIFVY